MKRIFLLIVTNLAVMLVLGLVASLLGVNRFLTANGLNLTALLGFAAIMGFGGAFISLLISKPMAKWTSGVRIINQPQNANEAWIVETVRRLAEKANIGMPEVGIFEGAHNREVFDICIFPQNDKFISCGGDKTFYVWETLKGTYVRKFEGHTQQINSVALN